MASLFHKFIEISASKPAEAAYFLEFAYMEQEIKKSYKQLKNIKVVQKPSQQFMDYWKEIGSIGRQEQVAVYFGWIEMLQKSLTNYVPPEIATIEAELYVKKSIIHKWEVKRVRLSGFIMQIFSKRLKEFPLKCFCIRKSKNKDHFSWVMQVVMQLEGSKYKMKSFHVGSNNVNQYQEWFRQVENRIDMARIQYFKEIVDYEAKLNIDAEPSQKVKHRNQGAVENRGRAKTVTELIIEKQLKQIEEFEGLTVIEDSEKAEVHEQQLHPNIFVRMFPGRDLQSFCLTPNSATLLECERQYSLYEVGEKVKIFITLSRSASVVFRAISESHANWNPEIVILNIKNKISSENSVFIYEKDKSKGFLYRERDYFFLRHCFNLEPVGKKQRIFMIEKSIDSIHSPPFMTIARGQKDLVWCLMGDKSEKECLLVVQGLIKGGGYMNANDDRQTTIKYFKKLLQLDNYLKQIQMAKQEDKVYLFNENWMVSFKEDGLKEEQNQEEFYSPQQIDSGQFEAGNIEKLPKKQDPLANTVYLSPRQDQKQFNEFMKQASIENFDKAQSAEVENQPQPMPSDQFNEDYIAPDFNEDTSIKIPQKYLIKHHTLQPKQKGKSIFAQKVRGHHLWKGQWAVAESGGLNYIDQEKMRQQKKVLTFIISRIGKNILSGKGILNISLPVDIFCRQSNIERLAMSFGYFPLYVEKVIEAEPIEQLRAIIAATMGSSHIYLTMEKPFNPILGETYQCWIDGNPVYFQQISHHPPIAAYLMKGRGYDLYGSVQAKMQLSINSGTGINQGIFTVKFDSGRKIHFTTPPGELRGLTYGERRLTFVDKVYYWSVEEGLFLEIVYNPQSKQSKFFSNSKTYVGEQKLADYFEGSLKKYRPEDLRQFLTPKKKDKDNPRSMIIPRSLPPQQPLSQIAKVYGRWTKYVYFGSEKIFDVSQCTYLKGYDEKNPLPSHSNFREDVVYRRLNDFVKSQDWKQTLQVRQRRDRKLREDYAKIKK